MGFWRNLIRAAVPALRLSSGYEAAATTRRTQGWNPSSDGINALVSGARFGLFGTRLNGWVWIDEQGARWHVAGGTFNNLQHDPQTALTLSLSVRPFGELGAAPVAPQQGARRMGLVGMAELAVPEVIRKHQGRRPDHQQGQRQHKADLAQDEEEPQSDDQRQIEPFGFVQVDHDLKNKRGPAPVKRLGQFCVIQGQMRWR